MTPNSKPTETAQSLFLWEYVFSQDVRMQKIRTIFQVVYFSEIVGRMGQKKGLAPPLAPWTELGQLTSLERDKMALRIIRCVSNRTREVTAFSPHVLVWAYATETHMVAWIMLWTTVKEDSHTALFVQMNSFGGKQLINSH